MKVTSEREFKPKLKKRLNLPEAVPTEMMARLLEGPRSDLILIPLSAETAQRTLRFWRVHNKIEK